MKVFLLLTILLMNGAFAVSAQENISKLTAELKKNPDNLELKLKLGTAHVQSSNIDTAELLFIEVANAAIKQNNTKAYIQAKINVGRLYADKGENVMALNHYQHALSNAENLGDKKLIAHIYKNIGALYISWKKFDEALGYYDKGEKIAASVNESELMADFQNNKGTVYEQQAKYDKALSAYKNALAVYTQRNISAKISMALSNVAIVYKYQKNYAASLQYNLKALALSEKNQDKWMMAATYNNIGNLYGEMGKYPDAIKYCEIAIKLATEINAIEIVESTYDSMANAAAKVGDYKNAFKYHQLYSATNDKFINTESTRQLSELNVKFETAKKQTLIQEQQFEISKRNMTIIVFAAIFIAVLVIGFQFYQSNKLKQEATLQAEAIKHQALTTKGIIEAEEKERSRIASDLHDGVGQLFSAVKLNLGSLLDRVELPNADTRALAGKTLDMVDESCKEVRTIAHQMMPNSLLKSGLATAIDDFIGKIDSRHLKINLATYNMDGRLDSSIETVLYRVVQECVNNVIKHSKASKLDINLARETDNISVTIEDNGKGFNTADKTKFDGIGLKNIITRVEYLQGTVDISSEENKGTLIAIYIPLT